MSLNTIRNSKISIKLTAMYALMFSLVLLLLNASILYGIKYYLNNQGVKQVDDIKAIILNKIIQQNENMDLSNKELTADIPAKENIHIILVDESGKVINSSYKFNYKIKVQQPFDKIRRLESGEKHLLYKNIKIENDKFGVVYLQIIKDMDNEYDFMKILLIFMATGDFIAIIAAVVLGYMVSKKMLRPIDHITTTAENISINNLKERIDVRGPEDELKRLGSTFNNMIDRLQASFNQQAQFVSDASHELRTPIAVIQGYANLLNRWGKDDREALEKSIYAIKLEADNMADLVEKLLLLAKGDSGTCELEKREFYLDELMDEVVSESRIIAQNRIITNKKNDKVKILADYKMIKQMLRVFIDNSIKFTSEQGEINISSEALESSINITVSDNGIGISEEEQKNIFDRFYTVDKSRSKDKGGTGLGLSIAKWIVEMHQGTIEVKSVEGRGTKIIVRLYINK